MMVTVRDSSEKLEKQRLDELQLYAAIAHVEVLLEVLVKVFKDQCEFLFRMYNVIKSAFEIIFS